MPKPDDNAEKVNTDKTQEQEGAAEAEAARQAAAAAEAAKKGGDGKTDNKGKQSAGTQGKEEISLLGEEGEESNENLTEEQKKEKEAADAAKEAEAKKKAEEGKNKPVVPEKYEFKVPEGMSVDETALELATPIFKKHNLTQEAAQEFVDLSVAIQKEAAIKSEMALLTQRKTWREEFKKDPEWKKTASLAKKGMREFGGSELVSMVEKSWLGDHPLFIKAFAKAAKMMGDDRFVEGGGGKTPKSIEERMYPNHGK